MEDSGENKKWVPKEKPKTRREKYEEMAATSQGKYFDIHPPVFWTSAGLIVIFITITILMGDRMEDIFSFIQTSISNYAGWFYVLCVNIFLFFMIAIGFSKFGAIRLGGNNTKPEFSTTSWFAMLFSAGMGIGILFWSVAEPIYHFTDPPVGKGETEQAASVAMKYSFLHWGLHAWGIYALVALSLAFFAFNKKLPLSIRSVFYPVLGDRIYGRMGDVIDILAVLSTLFGLATSLGLGVKQVNSGLHYLVEAIPEDTTIQILLITGITLAATASVVLGVDKGVKRLSELNINLGAIFLVFMLIIGPSLFIFSSFIQNIGNYINEFFFLGFWTEAYSTNWHNLEEASRWQNSWTVFYWGWWIAWSPFVGMFIARVSRGRTIREFVAGVLIVPSLLTFLWLSAFGGSALFLEMGGEVSIVDEVKENVAVALFALMNNFPLSIITSVVGVLLVMSFFVTSSDSGSLVIDSITSGGKVEAPVGQRIFWALTEGAVAAVLLWGGGLNALQTAVITTGLPFALILLLMCYSLYKGVKWEYMQREVLERQKERQSYQEFLSELISRQRNKRKE